MNILIFEPRHHYGSSAVAALMGYRGLTQVVIARQPEDIGGSRLSRLDLRYDFAIFHIPGIVKYRDGDFRPTSGRSKNALEVVAAADAADIPYLVCDHHVPLAWYTVGTDDLVPAEVAFFRNMDPHTNTFVGCYIAPDWQALFDALNEEEG